MQHRNRCQKGIGDDLHRSGLPEGLGDKNCRPDTSKQKKIQKRIRSVIAERRIETQKPKGQDGKKKDLGGSEDLIYGIRNCYMHIVSCAPVEIKISGCRIRCIDIYKYKTFSEDCQDICENDKGMQTKIHKLSKFQKE